MIKLNTFIFLVRRSLGVGVFLLPFAFSYSQAPQGFNYQAVARDGNNAVLANTTLDVKIGLLQGSETGTLIWEETHSVTTSGLGLFTLTIGDTTATYSGGTAATFSDIDWTLGSYYINVEVNDGGGNVDLGAAELLSVPYALFAEEGNEGPAGEQGPQGDQGSQGIQGIQGTQGIQGSQGPEGIQGPIGPTGPQGPAGTGLNNQGSWSADSTYWEGDYVFDRSTTDPLINSMWIFQGTPPHTSSTQPYMDSDNWVEFEAPEGPEGPEGPQGPQGLQGEQGIQGIQGVPGDPATDDQTLSIEDHDLTISGGNTIALPDSIIDDDADPANEIQDLQLLGNDLYITNKTSPTVINLSTYLDNTNNWTKNGDSVYVTGTNVGIGTTSPGVKLQVLGETEGDEVPLFEVKNTDGQTVFAVYNNGVRVYVDDSGAKGPKGGFAVGGFSSSKGEGDYMMISPDSVRFYIDTATLKGPKGGFAVGGFSSSKGIPTSEYLRITDDSVRIYLNNSESKGRKGGFAVGGYSSSKGIGNEYLRVTQDSVRVFLDTTNTKGPKGGFAVGGYSSSKGPGMEFLRVTDDSVRVYINEDVTKGLKGGFAVGGYSSSKGITGEYLNISAETSAEVIDPSESRILWYPKKEAFLTGRVLVESTDSVGTNSMATGYESKAIGDYSQALGFKTRAFGNYSMAIGNRAEAIGENSFAFGDSAVAIGISSFAFGSRGINWGDTTRNSTIASGDYSTAIGMGDSATADFALAIGTNNTSSGWHSITLGSYNIATGSNSASIGSGNSSTASTSYAIGNQNMASGDQSSAIGYNNEATNFRAVALGTNTYATGWESIALGSIYTTASGMNSVAIGTLTTASGQRSTTLGNRTTASGDYSTAMGYRASTNNYNGSFIYGDNSTTSYVNSTAADQFMVRAAGGTIFYSNSTLTSGVQLPAGGGSWSSVSDRNKKENYNDIEKEEVLEKLSNINIQSWNYKSQSPDIKHIGIVAQDFYHNFGYGESDTTITSIDLAGVNMVAVQGLIDRTEKLNKQNRELLFQVSNQQEMIENQQSEIDQLKEMVDKLLKVVEPKP